MTPPSHIYQRDVLFSSIWLLMLAIFLTGCIESIDFKTGRTETHLVVDGRITDDAGPHQLKLSQTTGDNRSVVPVSGATITIFDDLGNSETYTEDSEGIYLLNSHQIEGVRGRTYHIEIRLPNGNVYESMPETMPLAAAHDSAYFKLGTIQEVSSSGRISEEDALEVYLDSSIPETTDPLFIKWSVEEVYKFTEYDFPDPFNAPPPYCYVYHYPDPQSIILFNTEESDVKSIKGRLMVVREFDFSFYQRHYFSVVQTSMTRRAYEYWKQADKVINSSGTIFDVPPSIPRGNVYNVENESERVLGYFEAAIYDTARFFTLRQDVPYFIDDPCGPIVRNRPPYCYSCLDIKHSTKEEPFYWLE